MTKPRNVNDNPLASQVRQYLAQDVPGLRCTPTVRPGVVYTPKTNVRVDLTCSWGAGANASTVILLVWDSGSASEARAGVANSRTVKPEEIVSAAESMGDDGFMRRTMQDESLQWGLLFCYRQMTVYILGRPEAAVRRTGESVVHALTPPN